MGRPLASSTPRASALGGSGLDAAPMARPLLTKSARRATTPGGCDAQTGDADRLLNVDEAAAMLSIQPTTLRNWAYQRRIAKVKLGGKRGALRFRESDVQKFIRASVRPALRQSDTLDTGEAA